MDETKKAEREQPMKATEILMSEHRVIERVITALETAVDQMAKGKTIRPDFFITSADFIKGFADGCHHKKEEGVLFTTMAANGASMERGPIAVMLFEHEQGRIFTRGMREAALRLQAGEPEAKDEIVRNTLGYAALLRQHIAKEDQILFPMADRLIPSSQYDQVTDAFEHVEHEETGEGVHEKYLALADWLEGEVR
jgi:hemerythrin-like domain-containing protein